MPSSRSVARLMTDCATHFEVHINPLCGDNGSVRFQKIAREKRNQQMNDERQEPISHMHSAHIVQHSVLHSPLAHFSPPPHPSLARRVIHLLSFELLAAFESRSSAIQCMSSIYSLAG